MRGLHAVAALVMAGAAGVAHAQVFLRGQDAAMSATVLTADAAGVFVSEGAAGDEAGKGKATKIVGWDRVREVRGEQGAAAAKYDGLAEDLWRARTRIERRDFAAAEPLLERIAKGVGNSGGPIGPTGAVLEEGLLRCRLHRGAQASAVFPFLRWRGVMESAQITGTRNAWIGGTFDAPAIMHAKTGLCPSLPPVFLDDAAVLAMATSSEWDGISSGAGGLGAWYRAAAMFEAGGANGQDGVLPADAGAIEQHEDVRLVADIVMARAGNAEQRAAARASLTSRLVAPEIEPWVEAWCRVGIGRSLIRETGEDEQRRGVLHLLHVPARLSRSSPYLASVALAEAARTIMKMGDPTGAAMVKAELIERYPRRSAASWSGLTEIRAKPETSASQTGRDTK